MYLLVLEIHYLTVYLFMSSIEKKEDDFKKQYPSDWVVIQNKIREHSSRHLKPRRHRQCQYVTRRPT